MTREELVQIFQETTFPVGQLDAFLYGVSIGSKMDITHSEELQNKIIMVMREYFDLQTTTSFQRMCARDIIELIKESR